MSKVDRAGWIGGSDLAAIIGVSPWKDAHALYLEKTGALPPDEAETKAQRRGRLLESAIANLYAEDTGARIEQGDTFELPTAPGIPGRAQVDFIEIVPVGDDTKETPRIPLEIKSASEFTRGQWGPSGTDDAPVYYCTQVHWQIAATGADFGRLVALLGADDLRVYTIPRDEKVIAYLLDAAREFWQRVQDRNPPPMNYEHPRTGDILDRLFRNINATEIVQAGEHEDHWRAVMEQAQAEAKVYEAVATGAKHHLLHVLKDGHAIDFADGYRFERKRIERAGYSVGPTSYISATMKKIPQPRTSRKALAAPETEETT